jgi:hypothetical protein
LENLLTLVEPTVGIIDAIVRGEAYRFSHGQERGWTNRCNLIVAEFDYGWAMSGICGAEEEKIGSEYQDDKGVDGISSSRWRL